MADERVNPKPKDIPDMNELKKPEGPILTVDQQVERNVRRYIRKDGVFRKDVHLIVQGAIGPRDAEQKVIEICESAGRTIERDELTGRPKAIPGWNLDIRVPGFDTVEQNAPAEREGAVRERINNRLLLDLQKQNEQLVERIGQLESEKQDQGTPIKQNQDLSVLNKAELAALALLEKVDITDAKTKPEMIAAIEDSRSSRVKDD